MFFFWFSRPFPGYQGPCVSTSSVEINICPFDSVSLRAFCLAAFTILGISFLWVNSYLCAIAFGLATRSARCNFFFTGICPFGSVSLCAFCLAAFTILGISFLWVHSYLCAVAFGLASQSACSHFFFWGLLVPLCTCRQPPLCTPASLFLIYLAISLHGVAQFAADRPS